MDADYISDLFHERMKVITSDVINLPAMIELERKLEEAGLVACAADMRKRIKHYQKAAAK